MNHDGQIRNALVLVEGRITALTEVLQDDTLPVTTGVLVAAAVGHLHSVRLLLAAAERT